MLCNRYMLDAVNWLLKGETHNPKFSQSLTFFLAPKPHEEKFIYACACLIPIPGTEESKL